MPGGASTPQKIAIAERRHMALDLRKQGGSYRSVAATLSRVEGISEKYDHAQAIRDVADELRRFNESNKENVGILKRLELERLDALHFAHWKAAVAGDVKAGLFILRLMERRARLEGLDAPLTMKHSGDPEHPIARVFTIKVDRRRDDDDFIDILDGDAPVAGLLAAPGQDAEGSELP